MIRDELDNLFDLSKSVNKETADLQTNTCAQVVKMLNDVPGIILGDDVGMGKTYIAFSTAVYFLSQYPRKKIVIITPNWLLNDKWYNDIRNFIEQNLLPDSVILKNSDIKQIYQSGFGTYVGQLKNASKNGKVILIPINVFSSMGWKIEKSFYLSCWFKHRRFWGKTREEILDAMGGDTEVYAPEDLGDMGIGFDGIPDEWYEPLDDVYDTEGLSVNGISRLGEEIKQLRYRIVNKVMPKASLLILDEAHKMKNEETVKRRALVAGIEKNFDKGIFLTATPFQLGEGELRSVLNMFKCSTVERECIEKFDGLIDRLFSEMTVYEEYMTLFENYVHEMSLDEEEQLEIAIKNTSTEGLFFDVKETYNVYVKLLEQKNALESAMRKLIIRNIKAKDAYRKEIIGSMDDDNSRGLPLSEESFIPYALMEKAIYQILNKGDRTFIANVKQSFTSSFEAVTSSNIMTKDIRAMQMFAKLDLNLIAHPKVSNVCHKAVDLLMNGDKTLIFCDRIETMNTLKNTLGVELNRNIDKSIKKLFPENGRKGFDNYCKRFYAKQDVSWFLLQESYIHSILIPVIRLCGADISLIPNAIEINAEVNMLYQNFNTTNKTNYMYVKRIVEQIVFKKVLYSLTDWKHKLKDEKMLLTTIFSIIDTDYIQLGLNLKRDDDEEITVEESENDIRNISNDLINTVLNYKGIWVLYSDYLNKLQPSERDDIVNAMIQFLRRDRRFFIQLRIMQDKYQNKKNDYSFLITRTFESGSFLDWKSAYQRFLERYTTETDADREEMCLGLDNKADVVSIINASTTNDARKRIKAGFNTPFYPQILIVTKTMQEGIDLQKECKEVIHYDMEWNPASMEQRVGRVDRIGSLISALRENDEEKTLDVYYPYIKNTIDESIYNTVKDREKWFNLILGGMPQWDTFELDEDVTSIKPWVFKSLQIDLSVR
ncbi:helicase-related protein [Lachnospiraceae bacterium LCP25S3_G4]